MFSNLNWVFEMEAELNAADDYIQECGEPSESKEALDAESDYRCAQSRAADPDWKFVGSDRDNPNHYTFTGWTPMVAEDDCPF